jgi:hypothetical protein
MDPIEPVSPRPAAIPSVGSTPVERLEPISRERDRPPHERPEGRRRPPPPPAVEEDPDDGERPHVDVRV